MTTACGITEASPKPRSCTRREGDYQSISNESTKVVLCTMALIFQFHSPPNTAVPVIAVTNINADTATTVAIVTVSSPAEYPVEVSDA
jgi:hypothetical protein